MNVGALAGQVRAALGSPDLTAYKDLLAPDVYWGPPDSPQWGCHNREQVLAWYRKARRKGVSANVTEVVAGRDALLVGLDVTGREDSLRWQVLRVRDGLITDICGFDNRDEAATRAGVE